MRSGDEVCVPLKNSVGTDRGWIFHCPGCKYGHRFDDIIWKFNGDLVKPTLSPSYLTGHDGFTKNRCHSFIKDGKIQFLDDCFHELRGQTIDLPKFDDEDWRNK